MVKCIGTTRGTRKSFAKSALLFRIKVVHGPPDKTAATVPESRPGVFTTTHWSLVLAAGDKTSAKAAEALEILCRAYWYPLYLYVRRKGYAAADAQDLTQEFFSRLLSRDFLNIADRNRGKFRSFLLGSLEHFLAREWNKAHAQKRGGGHYHFSLDEKDAENRYFVEPAHTLTPEKIFERRWATTLLDHAMTKLRDECFADGKGDLFTKVQHLLPGEKSTVSYSQIAGDLRTSEDAIKMAVHRLRRRYGELVRAEIAQTVSTSDEVEQELRYLCAILRD